MKWLWSLIALLLTTPCFADYGYERDPEKIFTACITILGSLVGLFLIFAIPCVVLYVIFYGAGKLFEKMGGKTEHYEAACAAMIGLFALGSKSMKKRR
jgi:hypothetical protein